MSPAVNPCDCRRYERGPDAEELDAVYGSVTNVVECEVFGWHEEATAASGRVEGTASV